MNVKHWLLAITLAAAVILIAGACDDGDLSGPITNAAPRTEISGGPKPFDKNSYLVDLNWFGEDVDGEISGFEYAWDDTSDWISTALTGSTFVIASDSCCVFDTIPGDGGDEIVTEQFFRFHTFFIRAIDNLDKRDPSPALITFNSVTVAPTTRITRGPLESGSVTGPAVSVHWEGTDPDRPDNRVAAYEFFHETVGQLERKYGHVSSAPVTRETWNRLDWVRVSADTQSVVLRNLEPTVSAATRHMFFVRSIDEAGAVEQIPINGTNYFLWGVAENPSGAFLIRSNVMGERASTSAPLRGQIFEGTELIFSWTADLRSYDGVVTGYSHAYDNLIWGPWDLADRRFPGPGERFTPTKGVHTFFARARDEAGLIVEGKFEFQVFAGPVDVETTSVMHWVDFWVDDDPDFFPPPHLYEPFWEDTLLENFSLDVVFRPLSGGNIPKPPVREMSKSTTLILSLQDELNAAQPFVSSLNDRSENPIWSYVDAGGNLLISGFIPGWGFTPDNDFVDTGFVPIPSPCWHLFNASPDNCGSEMVWFHPVVADSIPHPIYEYCGIETTQISERFDKLWSAKSLFAGIPDLIVDSTRAQLRVLEGIALCERLKYRKDRGVVPLWEFRREIDPDGVPIGSELPVALFIPSDGRRGNVVYIGMPLYYFDPLVTKQAIELIMVNLFGEKFRS